MAATKNHLEVVFCEVTEKNVEQLRLMNGIIFPVKYNDQFYKDVYKNIKLAQFGHYNDTPIGAVGARVEKNEESGELTQLYIMTLGVLEPYRRCGVATQMLEYILDLMKTDEEFKELLTVVIHVQTNNEAALGMYKSHGFEITGHKDDYYKVRAKAPPCLSSCLSLAAAPLRWLANCRLLYAKQNLEPSDCHILTYVIERPAEPEVEEVKAGDPS